MKSKLQIFSLLAVAFFFALLTTSTFKELITHPYSREIGPGAKADVTYYEFTLTNAHVVIHSETSFVLVDAATGTQIASSEAVSNQLSGSLTGKYRLSYPINATDKNKRATIEATAPATITISWPTAQTLILSGFLLVFFTLVWLIILARANIFTKKSL